MEFAFVKFPEMLVELLRRENAANVMPDLDLDVYMKVLEDKVHKYKIIAKVHKYTNKYPNGSTNKVHKYTKHSLRR